MGSLLIAHPSAQSVVIAKRGSRLILLEFRGHGRGEDLINGQAIRANSAGPTFAVVLRRVYFRLRPWKTLARRNPQVTPEALE